MRGYGGWVGDAKIRKKENENRYDDALELSCMKTLV